MPDIHRFAQELARWHTQPFRPEDNGWWQRLLQHAAPKALAKGALLLRAGDPWADLFWLESGACRLFYATENGAESNKNFYLQGAMFWPVTRRLQTEPVCFNVEALSPTRVWRLPWRQWHACAGQDPNWQAHERWVLEQLLDDKMQREQAFLQLSATQRYLLLAQAHPEWLSAIPLRHLASYIGVTDVAISRIRRRLRQQRP